MRILMTADTIGGVWTYSLDLIRELGKQGVETVLVTAGRTLSREQRAALRSLTGVTVYESGYRLEWMDDPWDDVDAMGRWLLEIADKVCPDLIHLNQYSHARLPWERPCVVVSHSDIFSWFHWVKGELPGSRWRRYHEEVKNSLRAADLVIAPSQAVLRDITREYGTLTNLKLIPNGRSSFGFREAEKENFVFTVGRIWDEAKNIAALDEIAEELPADVLAAGSCVDPSDSRLKKVPRNIEHLEELTPAQLAKYFGRAGIFALPAKYEPFGLSVLEAAMNGCALVLGDIPSLRENWHDVALFVKPDDRVELKETLLSVLKNPEYRQELGKRARAKSAFFDSTRMGTAYLDAYRSILAERTQACAS